MKRQAFIKSSLLGLGAVSMTPLAFAHVKPSFEDSNPLKEDQPKSLRPKIVKNGQGDTLSVIGDQQTIKLTGKDTYGQFTLIEENNVPGTQIPLHVHDDEDEVFHLLAGQLEVQIGDETKQLQAGDIIFCPRGVPHAWKVIGNENAKVMLSIFPAGLEQMFRELASLPAGPPDFKKVTEICSAYNIRFV